jgi:hypothetical protein
MSRKVTVRSHEFHKNNLVTLKDNLGPYDLQQCIHCKASVKVRTLGEAPNSKAICIAREFNLPSKIKIIQCEAFGNRFSNLTPGSIHVTVDAPKPLVEKADGVWVMGVGEPVKVLNGEYEIVE